MSSRERRLLDKDKEIRKLKGIAGHYFTCTINSAIKNEKLKQELIRTRKALDVALDWLEQVATPEKCDDDLCREFTKRKLAEIKTALEKSELENLEMLVNNVFK